MSEESRLCKDCKHVQRCWMFPWESEFFRCKKNQKDASPVDGKVEYMICDIVRSFNDNTCGINGKLFERKESWWMI